MYFTLSIARCILLCLTPDDFTRQCEKCPRVKGLMLHRCFSLSFQVIGFNIQYSCFLGKGGRVASGISLSQFVSKNLAVKNLDDSNPRESILRHAKVGVVVWR